MYKSWNVLENKELFKNVINSSLKEMNDEDYYYSNGYFYEKLLNFSDDKLKNIDIILDQGKLKGILIKSKQYGLNFIEPTNLTGKNMLSFINDEYKNYIIATDAFIDNENIYKTANMQSSINESVYESYYTFLIPKKLDENIIRDNIEKEIFPKLDKNNLIFENLTGKEISKELNEKYKNNICFSGIERKHNGQFGVAGFHYFAIDYVDDSKQFLVCKQDGNYIGVIKHGIYNNYGQIPHQGLPYIDVNHNYRNNGIATMMIKELNKYLLKDYPLFLTAESNMGRKCHMENLFLENITKTECVPYKGQEEYYNKHRNMINRDDER